MNCSRCRKEVGRLSLIEGKDYCDRCLSIVWDIRDSKQYYEKLFVNCPFCNKKIDITEESHRKCPKCQTIIIQPKYCGFCEEDFQFRKRIDPN